MSKTKIGPNGSIRSTVPGKEKDKWCPKCADYRPRNQFHKDSGRVAGVSVYCNECSESRNRLAEARRRVSAEAKRARDARKAEKEESKAQFFAAAADRKKREHEYLLLAFARRRAQMYNVPFKLTVDDIEIPKLCPVFGFPIVRNRGYGAKIAFNSPTIDRIIPGKGYVPGNIQVVSGKANMMKGSHPIKDLHAFAKWVLTLK